MNQRLLHCLRLKLTKLESFNGILDLLISSEQLKWMSEAALYSRIYQRKEINNSHLEMVSQLLRVKTFKRLKFIIAYFLPVEIWRWSAVVYWMSLRRWIQFCSRDTFFLPSNLA